MTALTAHAVLGAAGERVGVAHALETLPLLAVGRAGTAAHLERIVRGWRQVDRRTEARQAARQHEGRGLQVYEDADGMVVVRLKAQ